MTLEDEHLGVLAEHILCSWPSIETEVHKELQPYWSFRDEISMIDGIAIKEE